MGAEEGEFKRCHRKIDSSNVIGCEDGGIGPGAEECGWCLEAGKGKEKILP